MIERRRKVARMTGARPAPPPCTGNIRRRKRRWAMKTIKVLGLMLLGSLIGGCVTDRPAYDPPARVQQSRAPTIEEMKVVEVYKELGAASYSFGYRRGQCADMVDALVEVGPDLLGPGRTFDANTLSILQSCCEQGRFDRIMGRRENPAAVTNVMNEAFIKYLNRS
jgi:hypothetical protein